MSAERGARRGAGPLAVDVVLLLAVWVAVVVVIDPRGDFPLNDDWAYAIAVRRLLENGAYRPPGWAGMTLLSQALWGAAFTAVAGFSHTALRVSTLVLGGAAVVGTYLLARQLRAGRSAARLAALVLAANPLFLVLSFTFMTDVPMLAMLVYALLGFARALESGSRAAWAAGAVLTVAATLCRQPGIVAAFGFAAAVLLCPPLRRRWLALAVMAILLSGAALWLFARVMQAHDALPAAYWSHEAFLARLWRSGARGALPLVAGNLGVAVLYSGLFLLPLLIACAPAWRAAQRSWWRWGGAIGGAALAVAALGLWSSAKRLPMRGNVLIPSGLGPITLNDWYIRNLANDPRLPAAFWWSVTLIAAIAAALLVAQVAAAGAGVWRGRRGAAAPTAAARALLLAAALAYLGAACVAVLFDRYLLPLVPIVGVALLPTDGDRAIGRRTAIAAALPLLLLAAYALAGTHDYLAWNRARWQALRQLAADGVEARRIDGGLEFNAPLFYAEGTAGSGGGGRSWWWVADDEYLIAMGPVPGYEITREVPYRRWLPPGTGSIAVLHRLPR